jgi:hypothetical protein
MRRPLRLRAAWTAPVATGVSYTFQQVKPGEIWRITHLAFENQTGTTIVARVGILQGSNFTVFTDQSGTLADKSSKFWNVDLMLLEGDALAYYTNANGSAGLVKAFVSGELITEDKIVAIEEVTQ